MKCASLQSSRQQRLEPPRGRKKPRRLTARRKTLLQQGLAEFGIAASEIRTAVPASCTPRAWFAEPFVGSSVVPCVGASDESSTESLSNKSSPNESSSTEFSSTESSSSESSFNEFSSTESSSNESSPSESSLNESSSTESSVQSSTDKSARSFSGKVFLEVGFGGGEHLIALAQANPHHGFIGAEVHQGGLANCCALLAENQIKNVRLFADDARQLLAACADNSLDGAFVLFPDPWPKRRHAKRRIVRRPFLDHLARVLRRGASLHLASDDPVCQVALLQQLLAHKAFAWDATEAQDPAACWSVPPPEWHRTRYETKALEAGRKPVYLTFQCL